MTGMGTLINAAGILAGGAGGLLFGKRMKPRYQEALMSACGVSVLFLGIAGTMEQMLKVGESGALAAGGTMMLIGSMILGALAGEILDIEGAMERFGGWLKRVTGNEGDGGFVDAFLTASLTICIGAMAVVGAIQDGIYEDYSTLTVKAVLDLILIMVMTAARGKGCIFAVIPVVLFQGGITFLAGLIEPFMTPAALSNLSFIGSVLIFCVGLNIIWGKKVKVANMLPSIVIAVVWALLQHS